MATKRSKRCRRDQGQAIVEFMIFLPFMLILYSVVMTLGNSINGSINQQKAVRGYFYSLIKGNSTLPRMDQLEGLSGVSTVGMYFIGWAERMQSDQPIAPCYRIKSFTSLASGTAESCPDSQPEADTTQMIRVKTAYGICSATYAKAGSAGGEGVYTPLPLAAGRGLGLCEND